MQPINLFTLIGNILSFTGGISMLLSYLSFPRLRKRFGHISMWLAICAIGSSVYISFQPAEDSPACTYQTMMAVYFSLANIFTSLVIVFKIYQLFCSPDDTVNKSRLFLDPKSAILFVWGFSFLLTMIPIFVGTYHKHSDGYCSIGSESKTAVIVMFTAFYTPLWGSIAVNIILAMKIMKIAFSMQPEAGDMASQRHILQIRANANKLKWYPIVAVTCWVIPTIVRIGYEANYESDILIHARHLSFAIAGFFDAVVYFSVSNALDCWYHFFRQCFGCKDENLITDVVFSNNVPIESSARYNESQFSSSRPSEIEIPLTMDV